jgi:hypothetical protein
MTAHEPPRDGDHDARLPAAGDGEAPGAERGEEPARDAAHPSFDAGPYQARTPEPDAKPGRSGSIAPPGAEERAPGAVSDSSAAPAPGGGLLDRIRRKLGR